MSDDALQVEENSKTPHSASKLDETSAIAVAVNASLAASGVPFWAGEIGPHNGGSVPCNHSSMRWANFADSFWYLDAMATKAANGYSAFCRQDFVGIDYAMLDCATNDPLPDFYAGTLWSELMGTAVARAVSNTTIRAYAHCHPSLTAHVTVLLINVEPDGPGAQPSSVTIAFDGLAAGAPTTEYHLTGTPQDASTTVMKLNGVALQVEPPDWVPAMVGRPGKAPVVELAPASMAFVVIPGAGALRC